MLSGLLESGAGDFMQVAWKFSEIFGGWYKVAFSSARA
jgi:hypothetical protein